MQHDRWYPFTSNHVFFFLRGEADQHLGPVPPRRPKAACLVSPNLQLLEFPSCLIMHVIQRQQQDTCIAPISRYDMHLFLYAVNKDYADHWSVVHYAEN